MRKLLAGLAATAVLLTGCDGGVPAPGRSDVEVDTPELREQKVAAGIETCVPGDGEGELPDLTLPCLGGGPDVDLSTLTGPMLINVWNTNCGPCRDEMPVLQQFHREYGDTVALVGLDVTDLNPKDAIGFARLVGATYPQIADPGGDIFDTDLGLRPAYPQFVVLDADGAVVTMVAGGLDSLDEVVDLVETSLGISL